MTQSFDAELAELLGADVVERARVEAGYTPVDRWRLRLSDGTAAFAKVAVDETSADWLRREAAMYRWLSAAPFVARLRAWRDGPAPILVLEDLGHAHWPPPWRDGDVDAVISALRAVASTPPPDWLPSFADTDVGRGWEQVHDDPRPFLGIGFDAGWLRRALPVLLSASRACAVDGHELLHLDVRSDNICVAAGGAMLVDWNLAASGPARIDLAFWLPSLCAEGGPAPEDVLPDAPHEAALVAGFFAARAGLPVIPTAPCARAVQLQQLRVALPWACRALGLSSPVDQT
jgi:hypothetical protein